MKDNKAIQELEFNMNNIELLEAIKYLTNVVINDVELMNKKNEEIAGDYLIDYDLGNYYYIKKEDLESLVSITDTISNIIDYNKEDEENE